MKQCFLTLIGSILVSALLLGEEIHPEIDRYWPQWRGPEGTGVAPYGDPPVEWSEDKNVRWKIEIPGEGHASPIVWGDRIFLATAIETDKRVKFVVLAVDRKSGKILWQRTACEEVPHENKHAHGSWASNSPVTDGERVYAHFGSRGLYCFSMDGKPLWKKNLGKMKVVEGFGEGSSPALNNDTIVVIWDHEDQSFIIALDTKTGRELWKKDRDEATSWATPLIVEHQGKTQVITNGTTRVRSYNLATGELIWECRGMSKYVIPTPVARDGMVFVMNGFKGNVLLAIRLDKASKDITDSKAIAWAHHKDAPYVPSPLLYEDMLYFLRVSSGILSCFNARTGSPHYTRQKLDGVKSTYASPVGAKGRVYLVGRNGVMLTIKLAPAFEVLARNALDDSFTASPAIVDNELYLRGHKYLYCIARD